MTVPSKFKVVNWITGMPQPIEQGMTDALTPTVDPDLAAALTDFINSVVVSSPSSPQGRITNSSGVPVVVSDTANATSIYYTPYTGNYCPIYSGIVWGMANLGGELTCLLSDATKSPAAASANTAYDCFVWNDNGTYRFSRGPAYTNSGAGTSARAATGTLVRIQGILVNEFDITNGPVANRGTYVGTIMTDGSAQVDVIFGGIASGGTAGFIGLWNMYNRKQWRAFSGDSTDSWGYTATTIRAANASNNMRVSFIVGQQEDAFKSAYPFFFTTVGSAPRVGVGVDTITAFTTPAQLGLPSGAGPWPTPNIGIVPDAGFHFFQALERGAAGVTFYGDAGEPTLSQNGLTSFGWF